MANQNFRIDIFFAFNLESLFIMRNRYEIEMDFAVHPRYRRVRLETELIERDDKAVSTERMKTVIAFL